MEPSKDPIQAPGDTAEEKKNSLNAGRIAITMVIMIGGFAFFLYVLIVLTGVLDIGWFRG